MANAANAISSGINVTVTDGGVINLGGTTSMASSVTVIDGSIVDGTLLSDNASQVVQSGAISASLAGAAELLKDTSGTVTLSGSNSYTGGTLVSAGTLIVSNSSALPSGGSLTVGAGANSIFAPSVAARDDVALVADPAIAALSGSTTDLIQAATVEPASTIAPVAPSVVAEPTSSSAVAFAAVATTVNAGMAHGTAASAVWKLGSFQPTAATVRTARIAAVDAVWATAGPKQPVAAADLAWLAAFEQQVENGPGNNDKPIDLAIDAVLARFGE
jgi:autotransporter-associated beta strand protein